MDSCASSGRRNAARTKSTTKKYSDIPTKSTFTAGICIPQTEHSTSNPRPNATGPAGVGAGRVPADNLGQKPLAAVELGVSGAFRGHVAGPLVGQRGVGGGAREEPAVVAGVGHVEAVGAGIGGVAEGLAVAEEEGLEAQLRLLGAEGEEGAAEEVRGEVDRVAGPAGGELVGDLRRFAAQVERAQRGATCVAERRRDAAVLMGRREGRLPARSR